MFKFFTKEKTDLDLLKELELKQFKQKFPWWKKSMCQYIVYNDLGVPIEWTFKPKYDKNTICVHGKDMNSKHALKYLDDIILTSQNEKERLDAESTRACILNIPTFYV